MAFEVEGVNPRGRPKKTLKEVIKFKMYESELV